MPRKRSIRAASAVAFVAAGMLAGCAAATPETVPTVTATPEPTEGPRDFHVPAMEADVANPIAADDESLQARKKTFEATCASCHGM